MKTAGLVTAFFLILCGAVALWWERYGGQSWWATFTGTDYCVNLPAKYVSVCKHYGFWSGFGSVIPWSLLGLGGLFAAAGMHWRHVNCHVKGCPWVGRFALAGGEYKVCGKHHRGFDEKHPTLDHIWDAHLRHKGIQR